MLPIYFSRRKNSRTLSYSPLPLYNQVLQSESNSGINTYNKGKGEIFMIIKMYKTFMLYFLENITNI